MMIYMYKEPILFLPGPVNPPYNVNKMLSLPMIGHRTEEFHEIFADIINMLRKIFMTSKSEIFLLTSSGTGAVESAIINCFSSREKVLIPIYGEFSRRASNIMKKHGIKTIELNIPIGRGPETELIKKEIRKKRDIKGIFIVYNDTSPGVFVRNLPEIADIARNENILIVIDAVSILGGSKLFMDKWGIDVVVAATQKCLATPPGISMIAVSKDAWDIMEKRNVKSLYFDLKEYKKFLLRNETPFTPAINILFSLRESLRNILDIGLNNWIMMHKLRARILYTFFEMAGFKPFVKKKFRSDTVLSFSTPKELSPIKFKEELRNRFSIYIALGMGELKSKIIRIGNMGYIPFNNLASLILASSIIFKRYGIKIDIDKILDKTASIYEKINM